MAAPLTQIIRERTDFFVRGIFLEFQDIQIAFVLVIIDLFILYRCYGVLISY